MNQSARELTIYYCGHETCMPGHYFGPAVRKHYLLHVVLKGRGVYRTSDREYRLMEGEAFLIKPQEVTYYQADNREPWEYAWVAFSGTEAERLVSEYRSEEAGYCYRFDSGKEWREIILALVAAFSGTSHNMDEMRGYLYLLFSHFPGNAAQMDLYEKSYIEKAETYIRHNYSYPIQIADAARYVGIDRTYLYRIFMMHKGVSPKHYLTEYRILEAKRLLEDTTLSITETALSCGFHDASVFCRYFQKAEGQSPLQYRRQFHKADL
ncbi:AraC family transcriptional regulator [Lacrimispora amygdalina]|uniref:AraC family transcriptional regulator n=1 Tax=Lacrimispora amygdalina TaxID=253257 RepID=A0A3E2NF94_9FIRM|nr:AraC family transcriptional regulator [Clostridium indicum]RFZ79682.1 AraC family transcriptional regulator [Clostridium indicum]